MRKTTVKVTESTMHNSFGGDRKGRPYAYGEEKNGHVGSLRPAAPPICHCEARRATAISRYGVSSACIFERMKREIATSTRKGPPCNDTQGGGFPVGAINRPHSASDIPYWQALGERPYAVSRCACEVSSKGETRDAAYCNIHVSMQRPAARIGE